ncbi:MAG: YhbY family RNA-binding protein [Gemmatimonadota bacterium]|jgi:RNA-binding protein|nr:YhbY family RNA-binding protein [Gemmatimonadota bacterium]
MPLTSKARAALRAQANRLEAKVHVGREGDTEAVRLTIDDALRTQELVKVALTRNADAEPKPLANALAQALGADVVQVIGRTFTLYRERIEAD